jgi:hypothetical protein
VRQAARPAEDGAAPSWGRGVRGVLRAALASVLSLAALGALSSTLAVVPLGIKLDPGLRAKAEAPKGPYLVVFYTSSCLEPEQFARYWQEVRAPGLKVLAVNPPEEGRLPFAPPSGMPLMKGEQALKLSRSLKLRAYPTVVVVDGEDRVRYALEGPGITEKLTLVIGTVMGGP